MSSNKPTVIIDNVDTLSRLITDLGGRVVAGDKFLFDLPLNRVRDVVPKIAETCGLEVVNESEYITRDPGKALYQPMGMARLTLKYRGD